ncbi:unnamed protein product [Cercopithifilaria johnstoni]|uniref:Uncharacterized protein n=1 Tax=Cercopithifilaria johnstoni TaxID=2874296 RepID=A0A8J2MCF0_9BILA|nr:unnamed protein product [Cercopithifilaria johnstoni]
MYLPFSPILITIFIAIDVKADIEIINEKSLDGQEWSQTGEENTTSLHSNLVNGHGIKQKVISTDSTKTTINDNFEDLKGRISKETLDLIKRLHEQYFNAENLNKQPKSSSSDGNKFKKEEIIRISGKLEIL